PLGIDGVDGRIRALDRARAAAPGPGAQRGVQGRPRRVRGRQGPRAGGAASGPAERDPTEQENRATAHGPLHQIPPYNKYEKLFNLTSAGKSPRARGAGSSPAALVGPMDHLPLVPGTLAPEGCSVGVGADHLAAVAGPEGAPDGQA